MEINSGLFACRLFAHMFSTYQDGDKSTKKIINSMVKMYNDPELSEDEKNAALDTLVEVFFPEEPIDLMKEKF
jgi:hypothetical protein